MKRCADRFEQSNDQILLVEVLQVVLSHLPPKDMQSAVSVNSRWKTATIVLNKNIFEEIAESSKNHVGNYPFKVGNLKEIAASISELKERLLTALCKLNDDQINLPNHPFFNSLVPLIPLYRDYEEVKRLKDLYLFKTLTMISLENLLKCECIVPVREFIKEKPVLWNAYHIVRLIKPLIDRAHYKTALEFINLINRDASRNLALSDLCVSLAKENQLTWLKQFYDSISDPLYQKNTLLKIKSCNVLLTEK